MTDVLKAAIEEGGVSRYRIAQDTGILETSLSRFMRGETSLRLDKADVLADYLGFALSPLLFSRHPQTKEIPMSRTSKTVVVENRALKITTDYHMQSVRVRPPSGLGDDEEVFFFRVPKYSFSAKVYERWPVTYASFQTLREHLRDVNRRQISKIAGR